MKEKLVGPVRSVRTEWAQWDLTNEAWQEPDRVTVDEYRPDGKLAASEHRWKDANTLQQTFAYDEAGLLLETQWRNSDASAGRSVCEYEDGRLVRQVGHGPDGSRNVTEEHAYAPDGSHTCIRHLPEMADRNISYGLGVEELDSLSVQAPGARTLTTSYDRADRTMEVALKDADGEVLRRLVISRDDAGWLIKAELFLGDQPLVPDLPMFGAGASMMTLEYAYDERGRRREEVERMFLLSEERQTYSYDDHGNPCQITGDRMKRDFNAGEDGSLEPGTPEIHRFATRFDYRYDAQGNWTERVTLQRQELNPDFTPVSIDRRKIIYAL